MPMVNIEADFVHVFQGIEADSFSGSFIKTHLNSSLMITLDHLGESFVLTFHISYIEDNACFKFGGVSLYFKIFQLQLSYF